VLLGVKVRVIVFDQEWYKYSIRAVSLLMQSNVKTTRVMKTLKEAMLILMINFFYYFFAFGKISSNLLFLWEVIKYVTYNPIPHLINIIFSKLIIIEFDESQILHI
jgi:hypothetical protein